MYASPADLRAEGVTEASDERLAALLEEASRTIDAVTGSRFEPVELVLRLDGRGTPSLEPPFAPIRVDRLVVDGDVGPADADHLVVVGAPVRAGLVAPRLTLRWGVFPRGEGNVEVEGLWGMTEDDGTPEGRTPLDIQRACMLLALRWLPGLGDADASADARSRWRVIEEKTRDQSYKLDRAEAPGRLTGDPEVDRILARYARPMGLGAA